MHPALVTAIIILGWAPMMLRLRAVRSGAAPLTDRVLLALTWILCMALTGLCAWDAAHAGPGSGTRILAGIALQWAAIGSWSWARAAMGPQFAPTGPPTALVVRGPYRVLRHPMYIATTIAAFGLAFAGGRLRDEVLCGALATIFLIRAWREERALEHGFRAQWYDYARRTLGILPPYGLGARRTLRTNAERSRAGK